MIVNRDSGSYDATLCDTIKGAFEAHGGQIERVLSLPKDQLPKAADANAADIELIVVFTGDGTINATVDALNGWGGALLVLPGGTMNLLSRKLHGDADPIDIVRVAMVEGCKRVKLPVAEVCGLRSLVGIVAGPTAAWGDVREDLRQRDLGRLVDSVPQALQETLDGAPVSVDGVEGEFQAIFIDPEAEGLRAEGIEAGTALELLQHGWAWLMGDFRDGPSTPLICAHKLTLLRDEDIALLVDGEQASVKSPCSVSLGQCALSFITTRAE
ncbi:diacylglycerol/lipid kinase family protein [Rhizorhapis sp. SPR117]|uniref:diacylglycerol/lipid kinase family protein n=1 Tax=Rhizorhapis sp. SPR117 TaxID=2912611 RepID=UPI001F3616B5|nr:sphingosine kinase [Rhizorhapis sp. SPR117]